MAKPVAVITSDVATTIPVTSAPHTVHLDGTSSTATGPATIASYQWYLDVPPESAAVLSSATSATPSFVMDVPGLYQARLVVTDSNAVASEGFTVRIDPATSPYKFTAPSSAYHAVRMSQALTETVPPTSGAKDVAADERELFFVVEELYGQVQGLASATGAYVRYVTMATGSAAADGAAGLPFNPQSAAANGYDGPVQQAVAALAALGTANGDVPRTVVLQGGTYDEDVTVHAYGAWSFWASGLVTFGATNVFSFVAEAGATAVPRFFMGGLAATGAFQLGDVSLTGNYAGAWAIYWTRVYTQGGLTETGGFAGSCFFGILADGTAVGAAWVVPSINFTDIDRFEFGDLTAKRITRARSAKFANLTLADAGSDGLYACRFASSSVFTGPSGSARFDAATLRSFIARHCTFASPTDPLDPHASTLDCLEHEFTWRAPGTVATNIGASAYQLLVTSNVPKIGVAAGTRLVIEGVFDIVLDAGDSCKVELTMGNSTGGGTIPVSTMSFISGASSTTLFVRAEVEVLTAADPGDLVSHYRAVSQALGVDEDDVLPSYGSIDLDPAISCINAMVTSGAAFGASSSVTPRPLTVHVIYPE